MKIWITLLLSLTLLNVMAQKDSTYYDYYEYEYTKTLYEQEKNNMVWSIIGSTAMMVGSSINYYKYGQTGYIYSGGLSLGFNIYSVARLIHLNRKIKKMGYGKSYN